MLISRFWSLLGVHHIQNMTCYNLKFNTKPDMGSTSHPFSIYYLIFSSSQPIWFSDQGLFTIWTAFCSYQVKKKQNKTTKQKKQTNKQKRRKCPEMAFRPSQWDCSIGPSEDCWIIASTSSWRSFNNIHFTFGKQILNVQYCAKVTQRKCANFVFCSSELSSKFRAKVLVTIWGSLSKSSVEQRVLFRWMFVLKQKFREISW